MTLSSVDPELGDPPTMISSVTTWYSYPVSARIAIGLAKSKIDRFRMMAGYDPDQPRDELGRFGSGGSKPANHGSSIERATQARDNDFPKGELTVGDGAKEISDGVHEVEVGGDRFILVADGDEDRAVNGMVADEMPGEWEGGKFASIPMGRDDLAAENVDSILAERAADGLKDTDLRKKWEAREEREARKEYEADIRDLGDDDPEPFSFVPDEGRWAEYASEYSHSKVHPYYERLRQKVYDRVNRKNTFITNADDFFEIANDAGYHTVSVGIPGYESWTRTVDLADYED